MELFGPFATRSAIRCQGRPHWTRFVSVNGDSEIRSPAVKLSRPGFYTYRERLIGSPLVDEFTTECTLAAQTALIAPRIITGGPNAAQYVAAPDARDSRPTRVRLASVGIDAAVLPVGIDLRRGALGTPKSIRHAGWWKDGRGPGATSGTILIAGHVDSARAGAGAFFALHKARTGDKVQLQAANGRTLHLPRHFGSVVPQGGPPHQHLLQQRSPSTGARHLRRALQPGNGPLQGQHHRHRRRRLNRDGDVAESRSAVSRLSGAARAPPGGAASPPRVVERRPAGLAGAGGTPCRTGRTGSRACWS